MTQMSAWVIVKGTSPENEPHYFCGIGDLGPHWCFDQDVAIFFLRQIDAERLVVGIPPAFRHMPPHKIVEVFYG